jgi:hypothetical protein
MFEEEVGRWAFLRRTRAISEETAANGVRADLVFAARARFGLAAISSSVRDNRPCAEFRLARIQAQRAANLEKESQRRNSVVA